MTTQSKIYSRKGTLLGTVTYPYWWNQTIKERGGHTFPLPAPDGELSEYLRGPAHAATATVRTATLVQSYHEVGAVSLIGCTLEEFERVRDCSFSPGAAYLRSLVQ